MAVLRGAQALRVTRLAEGAAVALAGVRTDGGGGQAPGGGLHLGFVTGRIARPVKSRRFKFQQLLGHPLRDIDYGFQK